MMRNCFFTVVLIGVTFLFNFCTPKDGQKENQNSFTGKLRVQKVKDIVIYEDSSYYAAFPSVIQNNKGEFIVAFRRAPNRSIFGERGNWHTDPNSYLVSVSSNDGEEWTEDPELIFAHPFGGSQDPCLLKLSDGTILCTSYTWAYINQDGVNSLKEPYFDNGGGIIFLGGYLVRSTDDGKTWEGPIYPPNVDDEILFSALGDPLPAYNRGALYEGKEGRVYWVVAVNDSVPVRKSSNHLLISDDKGLTWEYSGLVATDDSASFNETSIYETPKGDLVAFMRTANMDDQACIARSTDGGKTFEWEKMGFQGHPLQAMKLPDDRVLLVYGYRHKPYGIRARVLNPECTDFSTAEEIVIRDDGGTTDIGYPWSVMLDNKRILVVYYFNKGNGIRHIAGTILELTN